MLNLNRFNFVLGTAAWGWNVDRPAAFSLLDSWMKKGLRAIDAATNYPINKNPADFRAAEKILDEYIRAHGLKDLQINMKVGSINNLRTQENNLEPSFILMMAEEYLRLWNGNLAGIMIHWDHRSESGAIHQTLESLQILQDRYGLRPGLSGIEYPDVYDAANSNLKLHFDIQVKHNVLQSGLEHYKPLRNDQNRFFAYGINAGGLKLEGPYPTDSTFIARGGQADANIERLEKIRSLLPEWNLAFVRPPLRTMHHLGLLYAAHTEQLDGVVLGLRNPAQMEETFDFWRNLEAFDYSDVYKRLLKL